MSRDILIVDDSATIRKMIVKTIQISGLDFGTVYEASNGIEALAQLYDHSIKIMLVDINMPTMDGIQLLSRMKQNDRLKEIPIVVISTEGSQHRIKQIEEIGAYAFMRKPFKPEQTCEVLKPLLGVKEDAAVATRPHENAGDDLF